MSGTGSHAKQTSLPEYDKISHQELDSTSAFVKVTNNDEKGTYIRKSTAMWLFQEDERVSSDRLFRVRAKQPTESGPKKKIEKDTHTEIALKAAYIKIGDFCVFKNKPPNDYIIGKAIQFIEFTSKDKQKSYIQRKLCECVQQLRCTLHVVCEK